MKSCNRHCARRSRRLFTALVALAPILMPIPSALGEAIAEPCPGFQYVPSQGPSCPVAGGWEVLLASGQRLLTHGPDAAPAAPSASPSAAGPSESPVCVYDSATQHHGLVIYARPVDKPDRYSELAPQIRNVVHNANVILQSGAASLGYRADYKMRCANDTMTLQVDDVMLPTLSSEDDFSSIVNDLQAQGYTSIVSKYWVWYDDSVGNPPIGGQGSLYDDDGLYADNLNNGPPWTSPSYGITYGSLDYDIMQHENGHNLGAVQLSSPHSSRAYHCNDGLDIMCYADGGANQCTESFWCANTCFGGKRFDCGLDDYFNPAPSEGSYLAAHWNLGSGFNRYMRILPAPDLVVSDVSWTPPDPTIPSQMVFGATLENRGAETAGASLMRFLIDGEIVLGDVEVSSLAPGASTFVSSPPWTAKGGDHSIQAIGDYGDALNELYESNNERLEWFNIPPQRDTLFSASVDLEPAGATGPMTEILTIDYSYVNLGVDVACPRSAGELLMHGSVPTEQGVHAACANGGTHVTVLAPIGPGTLFVQWEAAGTDSFSVVVTGDRAD